MNFRIVPYENDREALWDRFVMSESANGTFLQTRRFLNYHPKDRFQDASFFVENEKGAVAAVVPAAIQERDGKKLLVSHPGSTYGGPVIRETYTSAERCLDIVQAIDQYVSNAFDRAEFKLTPPLFSKMEAMALGYAFYHEGFSNYEELNTWVSLKEMNEDTILSSFRQNKKYDVKQTLKHKLNFERLSLDTLEVFYQLLCKNLEKFHAKPVHSIAELQELLDVRLKDEASLYGVLENDRLVAATLTFSFSQHNVLHTQYIASDLTISEYSPAAYLYYAILQQAIRDQYEIVSFGISTEEHGKYLNRGLVSSKEGYHGLHDINRTYYKDYGKEGKHE